MWALFLQRPWRVRCAGGRGPLPLHADTGIPAHADGERGQSGHKRPAAAKAHAAPVDDRRSLYEERDISGGAADVEKQGAPVSQIPGQGHNAHDAGRRAGKNGLHGQPARHAYGNSAAVNLQKEDWRADAALPENAFHGVQKFVVQAGRGRVVIGRGDAPRIVELAGELVSQSNCGVRDGLPYFARHGQLVGRVARRELADAGEGVHALFMPSGDRFPEPGEIERLNFHAAVIKTSGHDSHKAAETRAQRGESGTGRKHQSHGIKTPLHLGIDNERRAERHPHGASHRIRAGVIHKTGYDPVDGKRQVFMVGIHLGPSEYPSPAAGHGVRMGSAGINAENNFLVVHHDLRLHPEQGRTGKGRGTCLSCSSGNGN